MVLVFQTYSRQALPVAGSMFVTRAVWQRHNMAQHNTAPCERHCKTSALYSKPATHIADLKKQHCSQVCCTWWSSTAVISAPLEVEFFLMSDDFSERKLPLLTMSFPLSTAPCNTMPMCSGSVQTSITGTVSKHRHISSFSTGPWQYDATGA